MLTGDLLRVSCNGKKITPHFIACDDRRLLSLAHRILELFRNGIGRTKTELEEEAETFLADEYDRKLADGLFKLAMDRADFNLSEGVDYPAERCKIFLRMAELLRAQTLPEQFEEVHDAVIASGESTPACMNMELYGDLPEYERLVAFKKTFERELLERYNVSLVQTLLLFTESLELILNAKEDPANLRRFFRYLKFFRLLFDAEFDKKHENVKIIVDGPSSILDHSAKYGLQFASFFPAVCQLPQWSLSACIRRKKSIQTLKLDQSAGLVSHYTNFTAYRPEEIRMFADSFRQLDSEWSIDTFPGWISLGGQKLIFPDFTFSDSFGKTIPMEIFHRWHASQLTRRLSCCEENPDSELLLAVDRSVIRNDAELKERLDASPYFQEHGMLFNDFPSIRTTLRLLNRNNR